MFFIKYIKTETVKNEEGQDVEQLKDDIVHIRTEKAYEQILEQIKDDEKIEIIDHGIVVVIDPIPKVDPYVCTVCKQKQQVIDEAKEAGFEMQVVEEPKDVPYKKEFLKNDGISKRMGRPKTDKPKVEKAPKVPKEPKQPKSEKANKLDNNGQPFLPKQARQPRQPKAEGEKKSFKPILKKPLN